MRIVGKNAPMTKWLNESKIYISKVGLNMSTEKPNDKTE